MGGSEGNMKVYKCIVTDSEFITDAQTEDGEFLWGNTFCKVAGKYITIGEEDIDIGANASAEGADADEGVDDNAEQVIDIVHSFRYQEMEYSKKEYMSYIKGFLKKCVKNMKENGKEDEVPDFKANVQEAIKEITSNWNDYCCYVDENFDCEGSTVLCKYEGEDGATPHFYFLMAGFKEVKY